VPEDWIFCGAELAGHAGDPAVIQQRLNEIQAAREESQPVRARTGGSTFVNPVGGKAWEFVDKAGCRGLTLGGAMVSEKHCNFLINTGDASAAEIEDMGETVRRRVQAKRAAWNWPGKSSALVCRRTVRLPSHAKV
jgi:UDP-N-acetylmuramate dehydrogenase